MDIAWMNAVSLLTVGAAGGCVGMYIPELGERLVSYRGRKKGKEYALFNPCLPRLRFQYAAGAAILWIAAIYLFTPGQAAFIQLLSAIAFCIAYIDNRYLIIPNEMVLLLLGIGTGYQLLLHGLQGVGMALLAAVASILICLAAQLVLKDRKSVGAGDIKLMAAVAVLTGCPRFLNALMMMSVCAAAYCLVQIRRGAMGWKSRLPLGGFIAGGMVLSFFIQWILEMLQWAMG